MIDQTRLVHFEECQVVALKGTLSGLGVSGGTELDGSHVGEIGSSAGKSRFQTNSQQSQPQQFLYVLLDGFVMYYDTSAQTSSSTNLSISENLLTSQNLTLDPNTAAECLIKMTTA